MCGCNVVCMFIPCVWGDVSCLANILILPFGSCISELKAIRYSNRFILNHFIALSLHSIQVQLLTLVRGGIQNKSRTNYTRYKSVTSYLIITVAIIEDDITDNIVVNHINVVKNQSHTPSSYHSICFISKTDNYLLYSEKTRKSAFEAIIQT